MVLAIYKKTKPKARWQLQTFAKNLKDAIKLSQKIKEHAIKSGLSETEVSVQSVISAIDAPETLNEVQPEKLLLN